MRNIEPRSMRLIDSDTLPRKVTYEKNRPMTDGLRFVMMAQRLYRLLGQTISNLSTLIPTQMNTTVHQWIFLRLSLLAKRS